MITQLIMIATISCLIFTGKRFFQKSKVINYFSGKLFSFGLFFVAGGILFYAIRDVFVQFRMYEIQIWFIGIGGILHIIGCFLILWFFSKEFIPEPPLQRAVFGLFSFLMIFFVFITLGGIFKIGSELQSAPFEPFPYFVIRNFILDPLGNMYLLGIIIGLALLTFGIILYNSLREKEKTLRFKGLLYGLGILLLIAPMAVCMVISPIYARIGYLIGAILIYKAFGMKI